MGAQRQGFSVNVPEGHDCRHRSVPFGQYNDFVVQLARVLGERA